METYLKLEEVLNPYQKLPRTLTLILKIWLTFYLLTYLINTKNALAVKRLSILKNRS